MAANLPTATSNEELERVAVNLMCIAGIACGSEEAREQIFEAAELIRRLKTPSSAAQRTEPLIHTDHPARHFDRTCQACIIEAREAPSSSSEGTLRDVLRDARSRLLRAWEKSDEGALGPIAKLLSDLDAILTGTPVSATRESKWIMCSERLPQQHEEVLIYEGDCGDMEQAYLSEGKWKNRNGYLLGVTHWMPKPEVPTDSEGDGK